MLLLSKDDIRAVVDMKAMIEANKLAFRMKEAGQIEAPLRTAIKAGEGAFLAMPSYASELDAAAIKVVNIFPGNGEKGLLTTPAQILLMDGTTGYALALLDGTYVTQLRTGAATGAAFDLLAKKTCRKGAVIGTGGQAAAQLEAMLAVRELETVSIFSRNRERCIAFTERMKRELSHYHASLCAEESAEKCVEDADLIITVTTSGTPVFDGSKVKPGATVSCVGTFEPDKQELDPAVLLRASKIICDSKEAVLSESGDLLIPIRDGLITPEDIAGSLGDVVSGIIPGRERDDEIIVFKSVGIAAQDLVAARLIYDSAKKAGIGLTWNA